MVADAMRAVVGGDNPHGALSRKHRAEKAALADATRREIREGIENVNDRYRQDLEALKQAQDRAQAQLKEAQTQERQLPQQEHSRQSQERARDIREGRDRQQFRKETGQDLTDEFTRRVRQRLAETKKRREEEHKRGKGEGRKRE